MFKDQFKLGGRLIRYGIQKKDGTLFEQELNIHNTITKYMLNGLLQFNGDNTLSNTLADINAMFVSTSGSTRTGVINYAAYGDGSGETSTSQNTLKHIRSEYTSTKKTGNTAYIGTYITNTNNNSIYLRMSYQFSAASEPVTIKEFGTFHKIEPNGVMNMTARVVLDEPISLAAGDSIFFTYELHISIGTGGDIIQLVNINKYVRKKPILRVTGSYGNTWLTNGGQSRFGFPMFITSSGYGSGYGGGNASVYNKVKLPVYTEYNNIDNLLNFWGLRMVIPVTSSFNCNGQIVNNNMPDPAGGAGQNSDNVTLTIVDYTVDSFRRDYILKCNNLWANNTDLYGFTVNGDVYEFGDIIDGVFTPSIWHKDAGVEITLTMRQSWSTDLLSPAI